MSQTRYCSTCGSLLSEGAAICGECGARYQASPYERRATDAPGAWSQAPKQRTRDLGSAPEQNPEDEGIELVSRESLEPRSPGATSLRSQEQYDQMMVTQPPMNQPGPGSAPGMPSGPGSPAPAPGAQPAGQPMERPLDGCVPGSPLKRLLAVLVDSVIATVVTVPLFIGLVLVLTSETIGLLPQILIGVGVALPVAYHLLMIWLAGAKGFTLGKLILGLRITRTGQAGPIGFVRSLGRSLLYGLVPPVMALSIFLDPKKHLRGFHDRVIDSVVVDVKEGRNPMQPRPDDFERESAEHYLGAPSVAVSTHQNLLSEPGSAWSDGAGSAPAQPSAPASGAWGGGQQMAPSPYAPPVSSGSAPEAPAPSTGWAGPPSAPEPSAAPGTSTGGWEPPAVDPVPPSQPWDQPAAPSQGWGQPAEQPLQPWDQPAPSPQPEWGQPPAQSWGQPAGDPQPGFQDVAGGAAQGWAPPTPAQDPTPPAPYGGQPPYGGGDAGQDVAGGWGSANPGHEQAGAPSDLTADAWGAEVDEQTRLSEPDESLGDLEQTRISPVRLPDVKKLRLTADDGAERIVERAVVIGRNPSAPGNEVLFVLKDDTRSVSKTHLQIDGTGDDITVTDLGSTNGSTVLREDGTRENLVPNSPTVLPAGAQLTLGDRTLSVERAQ